MGKYTPPTVKLSHRHTFGQRLVLRHRAGEGGGQAAGRKQIGTSATGSGPNAWATRARTCKVAEHWAKRTRAFL